MNLKFHLTLNIVLVGILCLLATAAYVLYRGDRETRRSTRATAESIGKQLEFQLLRIRAGFDNPARFPDLNLWKETRSTPGICVEYKSVDGKFKESVCHGAELPTESWPDWFDKYYRLIFDPGKAWTRPIKYQGNNYGTVRVTPSSQMELSRAWENLLTLVKLSGTTILGVCILVYIAMGRILRPTRTIVSVLETMREGNLNVRVPEFGILEWQRTGSAINELAATQQQLLLERSRLSLKLVSLQEEERRHLARELHDESGQCLAASNAVATSILQTMKTECPDLVPEIENILRINQKLLDDIHAMLKRLRPADLDELGLSTCLKSLISEWNTRSEGKIRYRLVLDGACDKLPEPLPITIYRIVQECLTNIAKHSSAENASVVLEVDSDSLDLLVENDGNAVEPEPNDNQGVGLLGIRERVAVLDGKLRIERRQSGGFLVHATIPFQALKKTQE